MMKSSLFSFFLIHYVLSFSYKNHKVYRIQLQNSSDAHRVAEFYQISKDVLDYWHLEGHVGGSVDVRVSPAHRHLLRHDLLASLNVSLVIPDVQVYLEETQPKHRTRTKRNFEKDNSSDDLEYKYDEYNSAATINKELYRLSRQYPLLTRLISIGQTHAKRTLCVMEITSLKGNKRTKPVVWVDGGMHAREWITITSAMYLIKQLLEGYNVNPQITELLDNVKFAIEPLSNPDGYFYSWNTERLWRKNRSPTKVAWCKGTDLNRNFDINFGGAGSSDFSCSEIYRGGSAFSELETEAMSKYLASVRHRLLAYFSLHSFGQLWLTPLSYSQKKVSDRQNHLAVAKHATAAIRAATGKRYEYGPATSLMYLTSGDSSDWVYDNLNCSHTYGIELRDNGRYRFNLPESQIIPTGQDTLIGIVSAVLKIQSLPESSSMPKRIKERLRRKRKHSSAKQRFQNDHQHRRKIIRKRKKAKVN